MADDRKVITFDQAVSMLPDGDTVHTFLQAGFGLIGADWPRENILADFEKYEVELTGPAATAMDHGLGFHDGKHFVFVATNPDKVSA